jgi:hypothetical protein
MLRRKYLENGLLGAVALIFGGARLTPGSDKPGPVMTAAVEFVSGKPASDSGAGDRSSSVVASATRALEAFKGAVRPLSHSRALDDAFKSYFAFKAAHPEKVKKPLLYFVDYGLPSTAKRGYVFDMESLEIVDGPFTVAHGRGSSAGKYGVPTRFSNASGSAATSLGLYVAQELYDFHGHAGGRAYGAVGMRLMGVSEGFNDNARARRVVAHGAPYVTPSGAGRSEGCPAMEPGRAKRLLPKLADGGLVFLFAPNDEWMARDPWVAASAG